MRVLFKQTCCQQTRKNSVPRPNTWFHRSLRCDPLLLLFACHKVWLNSIFSLPCVIARAEFHVSPDSAVIIWSYCIIYQVQYAGMFTLAAYSVFMWLFLLEAWLGVVVLCLYQIPYWQCFLFAIHLPFLFPLSLYALHRFIPLIPLPPSPLPPPLCSFCTCLSRCKQVHAPLIPAPPGPTHCGAVWGNGGHGTRRGFWIQSIQKRPGSFLAEF